MEGSGKTRRKRQSWQDSAGFDPVLALRSLVKPTLGGQRNANHGRAQRDFAAAGFSR
jgi:hypothetical protein